MSVCSIGRRGPVALVAGLAVFSYGAWLIYRPAGFLVAGLSLLLLGYLTRPAGAR